jgi:hypothetical protein
VADERKTVRPHETLIGKLQCYGFPCSQREPVSRLSYLFQLMSIGISPIDTFLVPGALSRPSLSTAQLQYLPGGVNPMMVPAWAPGLPSPCHNRWVALYLPLCTISPSRRLHIDISFLVDSFGFTSVHKVSVPTSSVPWADRSRRLFLLHRGLQCTQSRTSCKCIFFLLDLPYLIPP